MLLPLPLLPLAGIQEEARLVGLAPVLLGLLAVAAAAVAAAAAVSLPPKLISQLWRLREADQES